MTEVIYGDDLNCGIKKKVLFASKTSLPSFGKDTKLYFRYQTRLCNDDRTIIDDNRNDPKPLELIIGKQFKLEVWETCLKSMRPTEVSSFTVDASLVSTYPMVAKSLREIRLGKGGHARHCCGMSLKEFGEGFEDLDLLRENPQPLEFTLELLKVDEVGAYQKDLWALGEDEKVDTVPLLKLEGNRLFDEGRLEEASEKYGQAIGLLDQLTLREKPGDEEHKALEFQKIPLLLNFSQCRLLLRDFYPVITHTSEVLQLQPDNLKALFRRGRAHVGAWNPGEARKDLLRVKELDPAQSKGVNKELKTLADLEKEKEVKDQALFAGKMF